jgi:hypothetical protein
MQQGQNWEPGASQHMTKRDIVIAPAGLTYIESTILVEV